MGLSRFLLSLCVVVLPITFSWATWLLNSLVGVVRRLSIIRRLCVVCRGGLFSLCLFRLGILCLFVVRLNLISLCWLRDSSGGLRSDSSRWCVCSDNACCGSTCYGNSCNCHADLLDNGCTLNEGSNLCQKWKLIDVHSTFPFYCYV